MRKHGGEKGVPFRVQIDTFKENESEEYTEHLHSASCQIKVFKVKDNTDMNIMQYLSFTVISFNNPPMLRFSLKALTESRKQTERRWRRGPHRKRKSTSPHMKPPSWQRSVYHCVQRSKFGFIINNIWTLSIHVWLYLDTTPKRNTCEKLIF